MKTLTVKQPWANLIVEGIKDIENRTRPTKFRGRVLIHASKIPVKRLSCEALSDMQYSELFHLRRIDALIGPNGAIIGSVEIVDCIINHPSIWAEKTRKWNCLKGEIEKDVKPIYNWVLANPIKFPEPIPAKGHLSFWDYPRILAETEEKDGELFCHCQLPVRDINQVMPMGDNTFRCRYCGGLWYK